MNIQVLKSYLVRFGDTQDTLAEYLKISRHTLNKKINETGGAEFTLSEIAKIKRRYDLTAEELNNIFFGEYVS